MSVFTARLVLPTLFVFSACIFVPGLTGAETPPAAPADAALCTAPNADLEGYDTDRVTLASSCTFDFVCDTSCTSDPDCDNRCKPLWVCETNDDCAQFGSFAFCNPNDNLCAC